MSQVALYFSIIITFLHATFNMQSCTCSTRLSDDVGIPC